MRGTIHDRSVIGPLNFSRLNFVFTATSIRIAANTRDLVFRGPRPTLAGLSDYENPTAPAHYGDSDAAHPCSMQPILFVFEPALVNAANESVFFIALLLLLPVKLGGRAVGLVNSV